MDIRTGSGGVVFGSETSGGIRNVYVHDAYFDGADRGIRFKTERGRGNLIENIYIRNIKIDGVPSAIVLTGLPEKWLENIRLENILVENADEGARITRVKNLIFKNVEIHSESRAMLAEDAYEFTLDDVSLSDQTGGLPLLFKGLHTGTVFIGDVLKVDEISQEW